MIACLSIPYFVAAVERRAGRGASAEPLAVGGQPWEARPVYAFSQETAGRGVQPGMSLRLVQLLSPEAHFLPAAAPDYAQVSGEVVDVLTDFSPDIEPQELWHSFPDSALGATAHGCALPARYCLDLDGLPAAEAVPFMQEMGRQVRGETRFSPAIGLAADPFTAQVAAAVCRPDRLLPVAADAGDEFLSSRPLAFLPLGKEPARRLGLMGVRTLGQFAQLPASAVREQFGADIEPLHRLARGRGDQALHLPLAAPREEVRQAFDPPLANALRLADALARLAGELAQRLQAADWEAGTLRLELATEDGGHDRHSLTLRRPTADGRRLTAALQEMIATREHAGPVAHVTIIAADLRPATAYQLGLFASPTGASPFSQAMHRLAAKYKSCGFYHAAAADPHHPLPERRFRLEPLVHDPSLA
jgi:nucleotidyltransferase/DNA polymerase involved in DNA repair